MQRLLKHFRSQEDFLLRLVTVDERGFIIMSQRIKLSRGQRSSNTTICWQGDDHSILGCKRRYYVGLFTQEKYNNWSVLCKLAKSAAKRHL